MPFPNLGGRGGDCAVSGYRQPEASWRKSFSTGLAVPARRANCSTQLNPHQLAQFCCDGATSPASIMRARCATFSFGIARRTTPTQERHDVDEGRSQGRPRGRAFRVETYKADGATGKVGILRKRPPSFGFPIQDGSPQGVAAATDGLVYGDKERAIALARSTRSLPADQNRLFARPRRMVMPGTLQIRDEAGVDEHPVEMARLRAAGACVEQTLAARKDFLLFEE
jgi:hypothetical protein